MDKDMMVRNAGKCDAISGDISMGSDPIDFDWTGNHCGRLRRWVTGAIVTLLITLFTTLTPAHAAVESVAPSSYRMVLNQCRDATFCTNEIFTYDSAVTWCASYFANYPRGPNDNAVTRLLYDGINFNYAPPAYGYGCAEYNQEGYPYGTAALFTLHATCPNPLSGSFYVFNPQNRKCERTVLDPVQCPANSSGTAPACVCNAGFEFDAAKTSCIPKKCLVDKLPEFPPPNDACSAALENRNSTQAQKNAACGTLTPAMQTGQTCLENKLAAMTPAAIPFVRTGDIRSVAYQAHFRDIWDKMEEVVDLMNMNPAMQTLCADRRREIAAEKGCDNAGPCVAKKETATTPAIPACYPESATRRSHCLTAIPAPPDPNAAAHTQGKAIDVSRERTINPLLTALAGRKPPITIPQFLDVKPNCNLKWGGEFKTNNDPVHFYVP